MGRASRVERRTGTTGVGGGGRRGGQVAAEEKDAWAQGHKQFRRTCATCTTAMLRTGDAVVNARHCACIAAAMVE